MSLYVFFYSPKIKLFRYLFDCSQIIDSATNISFLIIAHREIIKMSTIIIAETGTTCWFKCLLSAWWIKAYCCWSRLLLLRYHWWRLLKWLLITLFFKSLRWTNIGTVHPIVVSLWHNINSGVKVLIGFPVYIFNALSPSGGWLESWWLGICVHS